ncbi:coiled-coil domain-containing protein 6-like [Clavelina lepadiformis]|uniref:Coiled-coil domain-containing protein 6 n=1 Tax=Clavelina lepadiformis TaxID=159417 RepID=A0ABP0GDY4_CLALP
MSESESDTDGFAAKSSTIAAVSIKRDELAVRVASLQQENRVLKMELETYKLRCNALQAENKELRQASVNIQAKAEQEEEFISNTLMKKIQELKKEKETLVNKYETEEEFLTNELQRQLNQLRQEKVELEQTLEKEQEKQVNTLMRKIEKLKRETHDKHYKLEELRREKIDLENTLEKEQEGLVNRLWKKMDKLETEKRLLQEKLNQPVSAPPSPRQSMSYDGGQNDNLTAHVKYLKKEVEYLRRQLKSMQNEKNSKMNLFMSEERSLREENARLHRQLLAETERREALSRQLSESESSLEMDDESRHNHDSLGPSSSLGPSIRPRAISSPIPYAMVTARPISPHAGGSTNISTAFTPPSHGPLNRSNVVVYPAASSTIPGGALLSTSPSTSRPLNTTSAQWAQPMVQDSSGFVKPSPPPSPNSRAKPMLDA